MMRIPIREQLAALILLASLVGLGVISIATWVTNHSFVLNIRSSRLTLTASLKASQLSSNLALMENSVQFISSRVLIQEALARYNDDGNNEASNWASAIPDMQAALNSGTAGTATGQQLLLQSQVFPASDDGPAGSSSVLNATGASLNGRIALPYSYPNGTAVYLGDEGLGYPPNLYPNFTYTTTQYNSTYRLKEVIYDGAVLSPTSNTLLLGPWAINDTFSLVSMTTPMINNTSAVDVLGWMTVILNARLLTKVIYSSEGLDASAQLLVIGPTNRTNHYPQNLLYTSSDPDQAAAGDYPVNFIIPLPANASGRHPDHVQGTANPVFSMSAYPALVDAVTVNHSTINNAGSKIATTNEAGKKVSTGYAMVSQDFCDWAVILEESRAEVWQPIVRLRNILLACVFGTLGGMLLIVYPLAHFASKPIRELRAATLKSVMPPGYSDNGSDADQSSLMSHESGQAYEDQNNLARKEGFLSTIAAWRHPRRRTKAERTEEERRREFRIPGKVADRRHLVKDELSDLTKTFNEMSDELMMQYERLEERVRNRTAELELSKKAAEAANESKTLFIANISHELKTPLNGIMGMCAVCMQEDDPVRLKRSLGIIYKSGDLLLNLLTDLLTFSKNEVGQQLSLDEKEFRLRDISSQILAIFDKQANEGQIKLSVAFQGDDDIDPVDAHGQPLGRIKDMILWGDTHRILQVLINLVSNSLKFTPAGGSVTLKIRCSGDIYQPGSRKTSVISKTSKQSKMPSSRNRNSDASLAVGRPASGEDKFGSFVVETEQKFAPPPGRNMMFEFEVTDTGPGIPETQHKQIFEPFVQGDLGLSKKYGGTGLGLSICSQLAGLMRGTMGLESELGKGSTFSMSIPLKLLLSRADSTASSLDQKDGKTSRNSGNDESKDAHYSEQPRLVGLSQPFFASVEPMESPGSQPGAMAQMEAAAASSGRIRVLVAEDNKVNQEVVLRMLKLEDIYDVTVAKDGQEALDLVKESMSGDSEHQFNLIFMDVQMPNLDGLQSTRLIREFGYRAPIVALTAFAEESNVKDCLESGMNYFLSKPIRRPALKKVLKEYCAPIPELDEGPEAVAASEKVAGTSVAPQQQDGANDSPHPPPVGSPSTTYVVISRPTSTDGSVVASPRASMDKDAKRRRPSMGDD